MRTKDEIINDICELSQSELVIYEEQGEIIYCFNQFDDTLFELIVKNDDELEDESSRIRFSALNASIFSYDFMYLICDLINELLEEYDKVELVKCDNCSIAVNFKELLEKIKVKIENGDFKGVIDDINFLLD